MIALTWQTLLLLSIAYFLGCFVGCFARKIVGAGPVVAPEPAFEAAAPVPAPVVPPAEAAAPVSAALREAAPPAAVPAPTRPAAAAAPKAFRRADQDLPQDPPVAVAPSPEPALPEPAPAEAVTERRPPKAIDVPPPVSVAPPLSAAAAVAAAVAERMAVPTPPVAPAGDDLTRIRAIDGALAARLNELGVTKYAEIADWTSEDVRTASELLGFKGIIERENWIEQAQILARGIATSYASGLVAGPRPDLGPDVSTRAAFAEVRPVAVAAPARVTGRDNLQRIGGINAEIERELYAHDIARYSQIAGWGIDDVLRVEALLGFKGRVVREDWIEQAKILARGDATAYSREFDARGGPPPPLSIMPIAAAPIGPEAAPADVIAPPAPAPVPVMSPPERSPDLSGMRSVRSEAYRAPDSLAAEPAAPDDLKRIRGIGLLIERKLNAMGISAYEQIANWTADDVGTVNAKLEFKGRIERENWIEQARILASGGHTDFSRRFERGEA